MLILSATRLIVNSLASAKYKWVFPRECITSRNGKNWWKTYFAVAFINFLQAIWHFFVIQETVQKKEAKCNDYLLRYPKYGKVNCYLKLDEFEAVHQFISQNHFT